MSNDDAPRHITSSVPPLSWPPPGMERLQGSLWRVIVLSWMGSLILVLPLLWALAVEQPFYSLGPFEDNWELGMAIAAVGAVLVVFAFFQLWVVIREGGKAAELGYGVTTILEVACDSGRDTGFLIQGKRHFGSLDSQQQVSVVRRRIRGAVLLMAAAVWLVVGFGLAILLAARGFVTPSGIWLLTIGPAAAMGLAGAFFVVSQNTVVRELQTEWNAQEGMNRIHTESEAWNQALDEAGSSVALGPGDRGEGRRFSTAAVAVVILFVVGFGPTATIAVTTAIGPLLAEIAVPTFLSVQEMAGGAEVLRRYTVEKDPTVTPAAAGTALQNIAFVGHRGDPEPMEQEPGTSYADPWFPSSDFPDPFSETVARDLMARPLADFTPQQQSALRQAAGHPAHQEFTLLARAEIADVVSGRWTLPFPDSLTFQELPWPRFQAFRTAGLARVAKAAVELSNGDAVESEQTLRELVSTGFLLIDQGPTLLDNLIGVELTRMGGNALEGFYRRTGEPRTAESLAWAREGALAAAKKSRAGLVPEDARLLLQGVPTLVENEDALRGLRWEYFATFNMLAPCINLHKMVFGPDETYAEWRQSAERSIVRTPGEQELFDLAESGVLGSGGQDLQGFLPRFLSLVLGSEGAPGSCASLIASLQS
ncbi:MAG: hypothetical protein R3253_11585 [Longimicrobiales bacterium]|nr:hypothetical protein [Longimicrobiales bacterium]